MAEEENVPLDRTSLVGDIQTMFDRKFAELRKDIQLEAEWASGSARKKVRLENAISFNNAGNKRQFDFNNEILDCAHACEKVMSLRDASKMRYVLAEMKQKLSHRNKIIRMADSSVAGWGTVQEYELNDLAEDSDDDRRIRKAEERAINKQEKRARRTRAENVTAPSAHVPFNHDSFRSFGRGYQSGPSRGTMLGGRRFGDVVCHKCGGQGHFASGCAADFGGGYSAGYGRGRRGLAPAATASFQQVGGERPELPEQSVKQSPQ